jgi:hypothetical protein
MTGHQVSPRLGHEIAEGCGQLHDWPAADRMGNPAIARLRMVVAVVGLVVAVA